MWNRALAIIAAIAAALAAFFGLRSKQYQAEAERDRQRAETAEASATTHRRIAERRREVELRHLAEQADSEARLDAGTRDHLEERW